MYKSKQHQRKKVLYTVSSILFPHILYSSFHPSPSLLTTLYSYKFSHKVWVLPPSLHFTSLHFTSFHFILLHFTSLHFTTPSDDFHFILLRFSTLLSDFQHTLSSFNSPRPRLYYFMKSPHLSIVPIFQNFHNSLSIITLPNIASING